MHTCPEEPFGLVVLEAMAADVPVLVPDRGGPDFIVEAGVSGFKFRADDAADLAARLADLAAAPAGVLNRAAAGGRVAVTERSPPPPPCASTGRCWAGAAAGSRERGTDTSGVRAGVRPAMIAPLPVRRRATGGRHHGRRAT